LDEIKVIRGVTGTAPRTMTALFEVLIEDPHWFVALNEGVHASLPLKFVKVKFLSVAARVLEN
jgi:hypothetical protein